MIGHQYYDNNRLSQAFREKDYDIHVQKITNIVQNSQSPSSNHEHNSKLDDRRTSRMNSYSGIPYDEREQQYEVDKQNRQLLQKLIEIKQGKQCFLYHPSFNNYSNKQIQTARSKSLNQNHRKKVAQQIAEENQAIALRILSQKPNFQRKLIQKDIGDYLKLREHMQRYKKGDIQSFKQKTTKLPPLFVHPMSANDSPPDTVRASQQDSYTMKVNMSQKEIGEHLRLNNHAYSSIHNSPVLGSYDQFQHTLKRVENHVNRKQNQHNNSCMDIGNNNYSDEDNRNYKDIYNQNSKYNNQRQSIRQLMKEYHAE